MNIPFTILHAMTLKTAKEKYNMERLEILDDSFLKYIAAIKCCYENPHDSQGSRAIKCMSKVHNTYLYEEAKNKNFQAFLIQDSFSENTFIPPLYINNKSEKL